MDAILVAFHLTTKLLHLQLMVANNLSHNQKNNQQSYQHQSDNQIQLQVAVAMQTLQLALLGFQFVFRLDPQHDFAGMFLFRFQQVRRKQLLVLDGLFVVALGVGNGIQCLIDRHFQSGTLATQGFVQKAFGLLEIVRIIIKDAQCHVGDVGIGIAKPDFQCLVDILDAFGKVAGLHVIVAAHFQIEVAQHGLVVNQSGDAEGRVIVVFSWCVLLLCPDGPAAIAVGVHHACGVSSLTETSQSLLMLLKSTLKESVFEIHRTKVVA